jgi:splicing factor 3A subunit 3
VTRKQARTAGEKEESEEEDAGSDSDDDDDDDIPYNPKNLPLGWDGKVTKSLISFLHYQFEIN